MDSPTPSFTSLLPPSSLFLTPGAPLHSRYFQTDSGWASSGGCGGKILLQTTQMEVREDLSLGKRSVSVSELAEPTPGVKMMMVMVAGILTIPIR